MLILELRFAVNKGDHGPHTYFPYLCLRYIYHLDCRWNIFINCFLNKEDILMYFNFTYTSYFLAFVLIIFLLAVLSRELENYEDFEA